MKKYIQISERAYNEYLELRRGSCIASDNFNKIRQQALSLSILTEYYNFSDSKRGNTDLSILIYEGINELYCSLINYEKNSYLTSSLLPKNEINLKP